MKKKLGIILLAVTLIMSMSACSSSNSKEGDTSAELSDITFVLDWTPNTNHTGIYVALEKGYYEDAGLNVDVVQPSDSGAEALVGSGKAQFGISFQDTQASNWVSDDPMPFTTVAAVLQHNTSGIISAKDDQITSAKDLAGKRYATWNNDIEMAVILDVIEKDGGNPDQVEMLPESITDEVSALTADTVDAIWVYEGWAVQSAISREFDYNYFAFRDIDDTFDYYTPVIIANDSYLEEHADEAKAFLAATAKGYEFAVENPDEAADILLEAAPELDEDLVKLSQNYMADQYIADADQWGYIDAGRWNKFYSWLNEKGLVDGTLEENVGFTNDYLEES